jgi:hypothetical protein
LFLLSLLWLLSLLLLLLLLLVVVVVVVVVVVLLVVVVVVVLLVVVMVMAGGVVACRYPYTVEAASAYFLDKVRGHGSTSFPLLGCDVCVRETAVTDGRPGQRHVDRSACHLLAGLPPLSRSGSAPGCHPWVLDRSRCSCSCNNTPGRISRAYRPQVLGEGEAPLSTLEDAVTCQKIVEVRGCCSWWCMCWANGGWLRLVSACVVSRRIFRRRVPRVARAARAAYVREPPRRPFHARARARLRVMAWRRRWQAAERSMAERRHVALSEFW